MYNDEASRLAKKRWFVQYLPKSPRNDEHQRALDDLRFLMDRHGEEGAWLWDPYLSARDILETLFYCPHAGTDLRALGWAQKARELSTSQTTSADWIDEQRAVLENAKGNSRGLRLEYRVKIGQDGWGFHDRFLIFPSAEHGGQAWSLGTSINSLGIEHHILQKVSDGQLVMNAFLDLWGKLDSAEHLVWKAP
jgi:hypothetical protein